MGKRSKIFRIRMLAILAAALLWAGSITIYAEEEARPPVTITIYHTNDMHGALAGTGSCIGVDKVAALKDATDNAILVDAGDATQGLPLASMSKGQDIIDIMNVAGYDLMAAGNHEFDYGTEQLLANANRAIFPILASNIYSKATGQPLLAGTAPNGNGCHTIVERDGVKVGFFGLTTVETRTATNPVGIQDVEFRDEIETAKKEIDELESEGADVIIAVAHLGEYTNVPCDSAKLANAMTGEYEDKLTAIIDGHSHTVETNKYENNVLIQQTGTGLQQLGKVELTVTPEHGVSEVSGSMLGYGDVTIEPKAEVTETIHAITSEQDKLMQQRICDVTNTLWGGNVNDIPIGRVTETNLGDFTADAYRDAARQFVENASGMDSYKGLPILAVENGGGIRASLMKGEMTLGDLVTVFPFSNTLMIKEVTPHTIYDMLENSVGDLSGQDAVSGQVTGQPSGGFLQVGGFGYAYDPGAPKGSKVKRVYLGDGTVLDRNDTSTRFMLVSNNFIMSGGNGYDMLGEAALVGEIGGELESVQAYINAQTQNGSQPLQVDTYEKRIEITGAYTGTDYEAVVQVVSPKGEPDAGTPQASRQVSVYVDGAATPQNLLTDEQGMLRIRLSNGAHTICLSEDGRQVYVNNYAGIGIAAGESSVFLQIPYAAPRIAFTVPSEEELTIAPGRSFYVKGSFQGISIGDSAEVTVQVLDEKGTVYRQISTDIKANRVLKTDEVTYNSQGTDLLQSGMPDLVWDGTDPATFLSGDAKCYYDEQAFAAMIPGGKTALSIDDRMGWKDSNGNDYVPLTEGNYTVRVEVNDGGAHIASAQRNITIGSTEDKILSRFSPDAHKNRVSEFAAANGFRIYQDPFPGYWVINDNAFCEIGTEWRAADATEYTTGNVHFVIYNVKESSTTYSVELGLLQSMGDIEKRLQNYYYSTGETTDLGGAASQIVPFATGDKLQLVRAEIGSAKEQDGVYDQDNIGQPEYDMNVGDGISANAGEGIVLYGVTAPIQIAKEDIRANEDNTYTLSNRIETVKYHVTGDQVDESYEKEVKLNRISNGKENKSLLEFKHVIPVEENMKGKTLTVEVKGYDSHETYVEGTDETFRITVAKGEEGSDGGIDDPADGDKDPTKEKDTGKDKDTKKTKGSKTGDETSIAVLLVLMTLSAAVLLRRRQGFYGTK